MIPTHMYKHGTEEEVTSQIEWLQRCVAGPPDIQRMSPTLYKYRWINGSHPTDPNQVWHAANLCIWDKTKTHLNISRVSYYTYVVSRIAHDIDSTKLRLSLAEIADSKHLITPVHQCHGDLTLENVICDYGNNLVFIDPGNPRGLPCQEIDEAKIMQSTIGWEKAKYNSRKSKEYKTLTVFEPRRIHWLLLLSHLVRLLRHEHPSHALKWAKERITFILEIL